MQIDAHLKLRDHILVAVDFQDQSLAAFEQSILLAKLIRAHIVLLHIIDTEYFLPKSMSLNRQEIDRIRVELSERLEHMAEKHREWKGIDITTRIEEGAIAEKVVDVAHDIKARYIFIGKTSKKENKSKLLGSNAYKILNLSKIPVVSYAGKSRS